ncbi:MAG: outer membrane beta-barrel protein [Prevotella sp.]|nr:outer membrane beta-barrel protein [Prevotella sp.]
MNKDWTDKLREQLAAHEESASRDLWADIEARLDEAAAADGAPETPSRRARTVALRRWAAAAVVVAVLGFGGVMWFQSLPKAGVQLAKSRATAGQGQGAARGDSVELRPQMADASGEELLAVAPKTGSGASVKLLATAEKVKSAVPTTISLREDEPAETPAEPKPDAAEPATADAEPALAEPKNALGQQQKTATARPTDATPAYRHLDDELNRDLMHAVSGGGNRRLSLGLYAQNGFAEGSNMQPVMMDPTLANSFNAVSDYGNTARRGAPPIYLTDISETVNHKVPLSVGLSVAYGLTSRLALQLGVTYMRAASTFSNNIRGTVITTEQVLHYVGIPLQLRCDVWRWGSLDAYATVGVEMDVNVKAETETEGVTRHMSRDLEQYSLLGGVGLQYDIAPQLGLYGEVGARWYPDNGSQVETYFKDKPLGMNIQFGLRLNVGR